MNTKIIKSPIELIKEITQLKHYQFGAGQGSFIGYVAQMIETNPNLNDKEAIKILKTVIEMADTQYPDMKPPVVKEIYNIAKQIESYA
jgi:hypothetical protein